MKSIEILRQIAIQFRNAIERLNPEDIPASSKHFTRFPKGCCGDTCDLLLKYYTKHNISVTFFWGTRGVPSHAWLECDGVIIDITADQFPEIKEKVLVTTDRSWHSQFDVRGSHSDFSYCNNSYKNRIDALYRLIEEKIEL